MEKVKFKWENGSFVQKITITMGDTPGKEEGDTLTSWNRLSKEAKSYLKTRKSLYIDEGSQHARSAGAGNYMIDIWISLREHKQTQVHYKETSCPKLIILNYTSRKFGETFDDGKIFNVLVPHNFCNW